jgi:hypothetical protein
VVTAIPAAATWTSDPSHWNGPRRRCLLGPLSSRTFECACFAASQAPCLEPPERDAHLNDKSPGQRPGLFDSSFEGLERHVVAAVREAGEGYWAAALTLALWPQGESGGSRVWEAHVELNE